MADDIIEVGACIKEARDVLDKITSDDEDVRTALAEVRSLLFRANNWASEAWMRMGDAEKKRRMLRRSH